MLNRLVAILTLFAAAVVVLPTQQAKADTITFALSGDGTPGGASALCAPAGCPVGGTLVIDTTAGTLISADLTISNESSTDPGFVPFGAFTVIPANSISAFTSDPLDNKLTQIQVQPPGDALDTFSIVIDTTTAGSLVGFTGGTVSEFSLVGYGSDAWYIDGSVLTPVVPAPEPTSGSLLAFSLFGIGLASIVRKSLDLSLGQVS